MPFYEQLWALRHHDTQGQNERLWWGLHQKVCPANKSRDNEISQA